MGWKITSRFFKRMHIYDTWVLDKYFSILQIGADDKGKRMPAVVLMVEALYIALEHNQTHLKSNHYLSYVRDQYSEKTMNWRVALVTKEEHLLILNNHSRVNLIFIIQY